MHSALCFNQGSLSFLSFLSRHTCSLSLLCRNALRVSLSFRVLHCMLALCSFVGCQTLQLDVKCGTQLLFRCLRCLSALSFCLNVRLCCLRRYQTPCSLLDGCRSRNLRWLGQLGLISIGCRVINDSTPLMHHAGCRPSAHSLLARIVFLLHARRAGHVW